MLNSESMILYWSSQAWWIYGIFCTHWSWEFGFLSSMDLRITMKIFWILLSLSFSIGVLSSKFFSLMFWSLISTCFLGLFHAKMDIWDWLFVYATVVLLGCWMFCWLQSDLIYLSPMSLQDSYAMKSGVSNPFEPKGPKDYAVVWWLIKMLGLKVVCFVGLLIDSAWGCIWSVGIYLRSIFVLCVRALLCVYFGTTWYTAATLGRIVDVLSLWASFGLLELYFVSAPGCCILGF